MSLEYSPAALFGGYIAKKVTDLATYKASDHPGANIWLSDLGVPAYSNGAFWQFFSDNGQVPGQEPPKLYMRGVALQGLESTGTGIIPGVEGTDYHRPYVSDMQYFKKHGANVFRLGYLMERWLNPGASALDPAFTAIIREALTNAHSMGCAMVLDNHNYGGYRDVNGVTRKFGSPEMPISVLANFYKLVYAAVGDHPGLLGWDIMNEPVDMPVQSSPTNYNPFATPLPVQLVVNPSFETNTNNWSLDPSFTVSTEKAFHGTKSIKFVGVANNFDNFTTSNSANDGYPVKPNTDYVATFYYIADGTGNFPVTYINSNLAFGGTLAQKRMTATAGAWVRQEIAFRTAADTTRVWFRTQNLGGAVSGFVDAYNITPGTVATAFIPTTNVGTAIATTALMNQACIEALRAAGDTHWILIEGDRYAGLHYFADNYGSNPEKWWRDPLNKTMPSFHYYLDPSHAGEYDVDWTAATRARINSDVRPPLEWAKRNGVEVWIGEFGVPWWDNPSTLNYRIDMGTVLGIFDEFAAHGTWYAGGKGYTSPISIQPINDDYNTIKSNLEVYKQHMGGAIRR